MKSNKVMPFVLSFLLVSIDLSISEYRVSAADTNPDGGSGLLKSFGGFFNRNATQTNTTNNASTTLQSLEGALSESLTNQSSSNIVSLTNRLHSFLGTNARGATNPAATTNVIAKLADWLNVSQRAGTNVTTNTVSRRAWAALTNAIGSHAATNTGSSNIAGGDLVGKLREWVASERQKTPNTTNNTSASLAAVEDYLHSLSTAPTNAAATTLTNSLEQARTRLFDRFKTDRAQ